MHSLPLIWVWVVGAAVKLEIYASVGNLNRRYVITANPLDTLLPDLNSWGESLQNLRCNLHIVRLTNPITPFLQPDSSFDRDYCYNWHQWSCSCSSWWHDHKTLLLTCTLACLAAMCTNWHLMLDQAVTPNHTLKSISKTTKSPH